MDERERREQEEREKSKRYALDQIYDETGVIGRQLKKIDNADNSLPEDNPEMKRKTVEGWRHAVDGARARLVGMEAAARESGASANEIRSAYHPTYR